MHHLVITLAVGGDKDDFSTKAVPGIPEELDAIGSSPALLGIPEDHAVRFNVLCDEAGDGWAEGLFLVGSDPNQEPIGALDAGGKSRSDACSGADADSSLEHGRSMTHAGCIKLNG